MFTSKLNRIHYGLQGTRDHRVLFTRESNPLPVGEPQLAPAIRLVDEESVKRGRLQLFFKGRWRGVCIGNQKYTNTINFCQTYKYYIVSFYN